MDVQSGFAMNVALTCATSRETGFKALEISMSFAEWRRFFLI
jgi:hypothetical protein